MQVTINVNDQVLLNVINKMVDRSNVGINKYGKALDNSNDGLVFFLKQTQSELMDAVLYMQRLKEELTDLEQEAMIKRAEVNYTLVDVKKDKYGNYN